MSICPLSHILRFGFSPHSRATRPVIGLNVEPGAADAFVALLYRGAAENGSLGLSACTDSHSLALIPSANEFRSKVG